jgi:uncharacterized protein DUF4224
VAPFLTDEEMQELTGYKRYSSQQQGLDRNKVKYYLAASGRPIVVASTLGHRTGSLVEMSEGDRVLMRLRSQIRSTEPNWAALTAPRAKRGRRN